MSSGINRKNIASYSQNKYIEDHSFIWMSYWKTGPCQ